MVDKPSTNEEWTVHSLNIQGTFFHRLCTDIIHQKPSNKIQLVATEYPVEYPPVDAGRGANHESRLDIYARVPYKRSPNSAINLMIECKKNNPDLMNWVFFPKFPSSRSAFYDLLGTINNPDGDSKQTPSYYISRRPTELFSIVDEGRETRSSYEDYKKGDKTRTANAAIDDACHQVVLATHSVAHEHYVLKTSENWIHFSRMPFYRNIYIPMVVTTAKLFICEFSPADVAIQNGEIPFEKVNFRPENHLFFEYPIPPHLQIKSNMFPQGHPEATMAFRRHVLIVNSESFDTTIDWIINSQEYLMDR